MQALYKQLRYELKRFGAEEKSIETLFIGGGTPSCVPSALYKEIFTLLAPYMQENAEITSEANPNSASKEWLEGMYELGVNRISFGVQSFNEKKLKLLGRAHTPQQAKNALQNAYDTGYKNLSLDLIYGVAGDTKELLHADIEEAFSLPINHLSAYALSIEENTPFARKPQLSKEDIQTTRELFAQITKHGFAQYEISNFGTYQSRHNLGYWEYKEYIGAGSGAVGMHANTRLYPTPNIEAYIDNPLQIAKEPLSFEDIKFEKIFLGLRSRVGIEKELLNQKERIQAEILIEEGKMSQNATRYFNKDFLLADALALFLTDFK